MNDINYALLGKLDVIFNHMLIKDLYEAGEFSKELWVKYLKVMFNKSGSIFDIFDSQ